MKTYKKLQEVLKKSDPAEKWISDFVHSDDPKFAGKSMSKRRQMALAAYYAKQRDESIEEAAADGPWHVYDTKTKQVHSTHDSHRKALNSMTKLNKSHEGYDTPGGIVRDKFGIKAASFKEDIDESYRLPNDSELARLKAHAKENHPGKKIVTAAVDKQSKHIEYVIKHDDGKTSTHTLKEDTIEEQGTDVTTKRSDQRTIEYMGRDGHMHTRKAPPKEIKLGSDEQQDEGYVSANSAPQIQPDLSEIKKATGGLKNACWKGYTAVGTKNKNGREVPNCVPVKESDAAYAAALEKQKENRLTKKDQSSLAKVRELMAKEKALKDQRAKLNQEGAEDKAAAEVHKNLLYGSIKSKSSGGAHDIPTHIRSVMKSHGATDYDKVVAGIRKKGYTGKIDESAEADKHWDEAEKHLNAARKHKPGSEEYHGHMSAHHEKKADWHAARGRHDSADREAEKAEAHHEKFLAAMKGVKEEAEQIDELKASTLQSYSNKAHQQAMDYSYDAAHQYKDKEAQKKSNFMAQKRAGGVQRAQTKLDKMSEEALDEISDTTKQSYVHKSFAAGNELHKQIEKETDPVKKAELRAKLSKRNTGIITAVKKLKEDDKVYDEKWKKYSGKSFKN